MDCGRVPSNRGGINDERVNPESRIEAILAKSSNALLGRSRVWRHAL